SPPSRAGDIHSGQIPPVRSPNRGSAIHRTQRNEDAVRAQSKGGDDIRKAPDHSYLFATSHIPDIHRFIQRKQQSTPWMEQHPLPDDWSPPPWRRLKSRGQGEHSLRSLMSSKAPSKPSDSS